MSLQNLQRKARRFEVVSQVKKQTLEKAMIELADIQRRHQQMNLDLEKSKKAYFEGITRLNEERVSPKRERLEPLPGEGRRIL